MRLPPDTSRRVIIALSLMAAGFMLAWLRLLPHLDRESAWTDGRDEVRVDDRSALRYALWDEPAPLGPAVNGPEAEGRPAVSPDGTLMVFASGEPGLNADLWVAELVDGEPRDPRPLVVANSPFDELAPAFGPDALWFASNRPGGRGGFDLLRMPYRDGLFDAPERLPPGIDSEHDELDPTPVPGSRALAFASNAPRGRRDDFDLYVAVPLAGADQRAGPAGETRPGATPDDTRNTAPGDPSRDAGGAAAPELAWSVTPLTALDSPFDEREPAFAADGRVLLMASDRDGGAGGFDLYRSVEGPEGWLAPEPLVGVNGPGHERGPAPMAGGFALLFSGSLRDDDAPDLYRARSVELFRLPGRPVGWMDLTVVGLLLLVAVLAWLGKRWEALDILAKCILVSLLAHFALMLWFREVVVQAEPVPPPESSRTFKVHLSNSPRVTAAATERAGQVQVTPGRRAEASAPERAETPDEHAAPAVAAALPAVVAPSLGGADAPDRAAVALDAGARSTASPTGRDVSVPDAPALPSPQRSAEAPALALAADASAAPTRAVTRSVAAAPARVVPDDAAPVGRAAPAPAEGSLAVPFVAAAPAPVGASDVLFDATQRSSGSSAERPLDLAAPPLAVTADGSATRGEAAPELALDGLVAAAAPNRSPRGESSPTRWSAGGQTPDGPATTPRPDALPLAALAPMASDADAPGAAPASVELAPVARTLPAVALADGEPSGLGDAHAPSLDDGRSETPRALALSTPHTVAAPTRGGAGLQRPSRWQGDHEPLLGAPASPAIRPLAAPAAVAAALPEVGASTWEHTPYRTRFGEARKLALDEGGGNEETERAVARGLEYLARKQQGDGHWGSADDYHEKYGHVTVGKTGLCLLAFLGAGHTPASALEHAHVARRARDFLLAVQDERTGHFGYSSSYSHAIATYALSECYALDGDPVLRAPLERAVGWILKQQNRERDPRRFGGWGYYYPDGRVYDRWPRTSVSAWQVMALESARLAGLDVPDRAFADARTFLLEKHEPGAGVLLYNRDPDRLGSAYPNLPGSTPAGLFALGLLGEDITAERYRSAIAFLLERRPRVYREASSADFVNRADGNLYFWYYASLVLFRHGGREWESWNQALQTTLLPAQLRDGSWEPISLYAGYAGDDERDHGYTTALNVLTLEVYYRYFTPLLRVK